MHICRDGCHQSHVMVCGVARSLTEKLHKNNNKIIKEFSHHLRENAFDLIKVSLYDNKYNLFSRRALHYSKEILCNGNKDALDVLNQTLLWQI